MSTDQPAPTPDEAAPQDGSDSASTDDDSGGPPVDVAHQAKLQVDGGEDDPDEVISTEGVVTDTTLGDWGADVEDPREKETQLDRPEASEFGVDDRPELDRRDEGEQETLVSDVEDGQQTITGEEATGQFMFGEADEAASDAAAASDDAGSEETATEANEQESSATTEEDDDGGEDDEKSIYGVGAGRRKTLAAIEDKPRLDAIEDPDTIEALVEALQEIALETYRTPPEDVIDTVESVFEGLPEDAQPHFVRDETLLRRINAARNQFNEFLGKLKRMKEMPSPVEAGPANYPAKKARKRSKYAREGSEELDERLSNVASGARGARQRALEAIGSSVAERNEQQRENQRERQRATLEAGDLVQFRNPTLHIGEVVRVNQKSVRVRYPNPRAGGTKPMSDEPEPDYLETRVDLDSDFLSSLSVADLDEFDVEAETLQGVREALFET